MKSPLTTFGISGSNNPILNTKSKVFLLRKNGERAGQNWPKSNQEPVDEFSLYLDVLVFSSNR